MDSVEFFLIWLSFVLVDVLLLSLVEVLPFWLSVDVVLAWLLVSFSEVALLLLVELLVIDELEALVSEFDIELSCFSEFDVDLSDVESVLVWLSVVDDEVLFSVESVLVWLSVIDDEALFSVEFVLDVASWEVLVWLEIGSVVEVSEFVTVVEFWFATVSLLDAISEVIGVSEAAKAWWSFNIANVNAPPTSPVVFNACVFKLCWVDFGKSFVFSTSLSKNDKPKLLNNWSSLIPALTQCFPDL